MATEDLDPGQGQEQELSLREQLEQAWNADTSPTDELVDERTPAEGTDDRPRDELGRFAPKSGEQAPAKGQETAQEAPKETTRGQTPVQGQPVPPAPAPLELKPPASWRPEVREKWGKLDPEVKAEVHRREREHAQFMEQTAGQRQFIDAFERTVRPFEMFIRAEQSTPLQAVEHLMQTAAGLRVGTPEHKVGLIASMIRNFNVDLKMLDTVLDNILNGGNNPLPPAQQQPQQFRDPRLDQILQQQAMWREQQEQQEAEGMRGALMQFAHDPKHEFYEDVRMTMADLIEMAGKRGEVLTVDEAYRRACQLDPGVSKILFQRQNARQTGALTQAALRAKRAAASITGDTTPHDGATVPRDDSVRAALEAAIEHHAHSE